MSKPELGAGDVAIELDGEPVVLKCSYEACTALCRAPGGLYSVNGSSSVASRILQADIDTIAFVIRLGLGLGASAVKSLDEQIYRTGIVNLVGPLSVFVGNVARGGQPLVEEPETAPPEGAGS